jgi:MFS family permease
VEEKEIRDELASIRNLMERSSKFISLSGLSGILAGIYALIGAVAAYLFMQNNPIPHRMPLFEFWSNAANVLLILFAIAFIVLMASILTALVLSSRIAKKKGQPIWGKTSKILLFNTSIPLVTGGIFIIILLYRGHDAFIIPAMLLFYGLSLVSASNFTFSDVKYLGLLEILLGLTAACVPGLGLLFWALGFGVLHIIYGSIMYFKYDK